MSEPVVRITVEDLVEGGSESVEMPAGDYYILCTSPCHESNIQMYPGKGTHIITIKGRIER